MYNNHKILQKSHQLNHYGVDSSKDSSFDVHICIDAFIYLSLSPGIDSGAMFEIWLG